MKLKPILALFLVLALLVCVFSGCASKTEPAATDTAADDTKVDTSTKDTSTKEKTTADTTTKEKTPDVPSEGPTLLTMASTSVLQSEPVPWFETEVYQKLWEMANVEIDYYQLDEELFNLALTSGDLQDITYSSIGKKIDDVISSKLALDMAPLLEQYAPNMMADTYVQRNQLVRSLKGGDEEALYFIADHIGKENARGAVDSGRGYNVRWDWYVEIGAPEINSDKDYVDVLQAMVDAHPTTDNGEQVYGTGVYDNLSAWYGRAPFVKPTLANMWTFTSMQYMASYEDGHLINGYTDTDVGAFWVDMRFFNEVHKRGLLDPDSFTQTNDEYDTKIKSGRYAATMPMRSNSLYNTMKVDDPDTLAAHIRVPSANALTFADKKVATGNFPTWYTFISAKSENWEAALRLFNVVHDLDTQRMLWSGFEGDTWEYANGEATLTTEGIRLFKEGSDELKTKGIALDIAAFTTVHRSFIGNDGYIVGLSDTDEMRASTLNNMQKNYCEYYGVMYPSAAAVKLVEEGKTIDLRNDFGQLCATAMSTMPTDVQRILEKCNDIIYRAIPKLVMAADDAEFSQIQTQVLDDLAAVGEADAWEWCSNEYNTAREKVAPIFAEIDW